MKNPSETTNWFLSSGLTQYLTTSRRRRARKLKLQRKRVEKAARLEYWSGLVTINGTRPEHICDRIADLKAAIALIDFDLEQLKL